MFSTFFKRAAPAPAPLALPTPAPPPADLPASLAPARPLWRETYPPRFASSPLYFDDTFQLRLARPYDDMWAGESSLLATPTAPVSVWVRNHLDELVAYHVFRTSPVELGQLWWPGVYSVHVEHPDFRDVLSAVKRGPWCPPMPPLDLLLTPSEQAIPPAPCSPTTTHSCVVDPGTSAQLLD